MELQDNNVVLTKEEQKALHDMYYDTFYVSPCAAVDCGGRYPCTDCPFKIIQDAYHKYVGALGKLLSKAEIEIKE